MPTPVLDLVAARRWAVTTWVLLAGARQRIDALNVFPVADGDTGTNMYLTIDGALDVLRGQHEAGAGAVRLDEGLALLARATLLSARGSSGVILSQLARGLAGSVGPGVEEVGPDALATAFESAAEAAWAALADPVEGTILSVARAAAEGARAAVERGAPLFGEAPELTVLHVVSEALGQARAALARTPEQLPALRAAGVVDAGGAGLLLVVEALEAVLEERPHLAVAELPTWWERSDGVADDPARAGTWRHTGRRDDGCGITSPRGAAGAGAQGTAVEVMYLLHDSDPDRADRLRTHLARLGDAVVVAGGPADWRVHVHLTEPARAVEAGSLAGRVADLRMTSLQDGQEVAAGVAGATGVAGPPDPTPIAGPDVPLAVVACGLGAGVQALFRDAGAQVVPSGPRGRASTGQLLAAVRASRGETVVLLPNDADTVMVARAAAQEARAEGLAVEVVPTSGVLEGLAAVSVLDPSGPAEEVVAAMTAAAAGVRGGALTRADRDARTTAGPCRAGQWLGVVDHDVVAVGDDLAPVAGRVLDLLWHDDAEVLTVLAGAGAAGEPRAEELGAAVRGLAERHTGLQVVELDGGQPTYPWLLGVE